MTILPGAGALSRFPSSIGNYQSISPFTERDGYTFLELLERIREWLEKDFAAHVDAEIEKLVASINEAMGRLAGAITDVEAVRDEAVLIKEALDALELRVKANADAAAASATSASTSAAAAAASATSAATELTELRALIAASIETITTEASARVFTQLRKGLSNGVAPLDELAEVPNIHLPSRLRVRPNTVFVGSSNALNDTNSWTGKISAALGLTQFNYAQGGTGFTQGDSEGGNTYIDQLAKAAGSTAFENATVGHVFIADAGNDIRSSNSEIAISNAAEAAFTAARSSFPNARIVFVPVMWGPHEWNNLTNQWRRLGIVTRMIRNVADGLNVDFVEDSWLWHHGDTASMRPGELHYTDRGHSIIANQLKRYFRNQSTVPFSGPDFVDGTKRADGTYAVSTNANDTYSALTARREGGRVYLSGSIRLLDALTANTGVVATLQSQYRPVWAQELYARTGFELAVLIAEPGGALRLNKANTVPGTVVTLAASYRLDQ